jgi:hypothetical protein
MFRAALAGSKSAVDAYVDYLTAAWSLIGDGIAWLGDQIMALPDKFVMAFEWTKKVVADWSSYLLAALASLPGLMASGLAAAAAVVSGWASKMGDIVRSMGRLIVDTIKQMATDVLAWVNRMVDRALNALNRLRKMAVGNSIIPDMVRQIGAEMRDMADQGTYQALRFAKGVAAGLEHVDFAEKFNAAISRLNAKGVVLDVAADIGPQIVRMAHEWAQPNHLDAEPKGETPVQASLNATPDQRQLIMPDIKVPAMSVREARPKPSTQHFHIDLRHAIIRDDKDMLERMFRSGGGMTGVFG